MLGLAGFRQHKVVTGVEGVLGPQYIYLEVTNNSGTDVLFYLINSPEQVGPATNGIPIKAGTTRPVPMMALAFTASGAVTVVAYGQ